MGEDYWKINMADFPQTGTSKEQLRFFLRYAILAPSSHNTQPWKFSIGDDNVQIFGDKTCWLKVADHDQRELHISVGCALENLMIAADHFGYNTAVRYFPDRKREDLIAEVTFTEGKNPKIEKAVFDALTTRHTNRKVYESRKIPEEHLKKLQDCGREHDMRIDFSDDDEVKMEADTLFTEAVMIHFADPAYREELAYWFGQGVFGTPWLISKIGQIAISHMGIGKSTAEKGSKALMSASHLGLISSAHDDRLSQVNVGEVFERLALTATSLDIRVHPLSEPCELPALRKKLQAIVPGMKEIPQMPFRLGYAEPEKHTPRRPLEEALIESDRMSTLT